MYTIFWLVLFLLAFDRLAPVSARPRVFLLDRFSVVYTGVAVPLIFYCEVLHEVVFGGKAGGRYQFLPLMFISAYSAVGVVGSWVGFLVVFLKDG